MHRYAKAPRQQLAGRHSLEDAMAAGGLDAIARS
jgi:hypothetical protein